METTPPTPELEATPPRTRSKLLDSVIEIATTVALAVVLYLVIQTFLVQTYRVEQQSMLTTLLPDQHLLIDKLTPRFDDYSRGDIVVFHPPDAESEDDTPFIKRVIGVGGDHVEIHDDQVWIDGVALDEPYVNGYPIRPWNDDEDTWDVPEGSLFVMGDHRDQSVDSRKFGVVPIGNVIGRAVLRFWPLNTLGILQTPTYPELPPATAAP
jgi:signal peptidase I